jgi:hypothetical protein
MANQKRFVETGPFTGLWVRTAAALRNAGYSTRKQIQADLKQGKLRPHRSILDYGRYAHREVLRWLARTQ